MKKNAIFAVLSLLATLSVNVYAQTDSETFTVEKLNQLNQLHNVTLSPQGDMLVYGVKKGSSSTDNHLYKQVIKTGTVTQLTKHEKPESNVVWSDDGQSVYFLSTRSGSSQIWQQGVNNKTAIQISDFPVAVNGFKLSKNGQVFALSFTVKPGCETLACTVQAKKADKEKKYNVRAYDQLMVRHWDTWVTDYKEHLFVGHVNQYGLLKNVQDIMPNWQSDFAGISQVSLHPEATALAFSAKNSATKVAARDHAWTTNFDIFEVNIVAGQTSFDLINITQDNKAWDASPVYSDNGRFLAYKAMKTPGYEADKFTLHLRDNKTGKTRAVASDWDRSISSLAFAPDNQSLYVIAQDLGQKSIFAITPEFDEVRKVYNVGSNGDLSSHGNQLYFTRHTLNSPQDIFSIDNHGDKVKQLTNINQGKLSNIKFADYQQFNFKGWNDETVYGYWLKPANFEAGKKYPIAFLVHGGPQGSFGNMFHYRWNAQLWAAQGYAVVMVDFHGSTGYGQEFTHSISRDWGGKPLEDLQKGLDFIVKDQPWLDGDNACALGASYGGYMMNWIAGNWPTRFNCLINHAGLYDMPSFYQSTEELWFPEYDMGGPSFGQQVNNEKGRVNAKISPDYSQFNPSAYVSNWQTPMLVIQGELDYRVPYAQSLGAFTTLQRKGIDSRLVMFPDEDHHIRNPDNLVVWYDEVFKWLAKYTQK
ncbi:S9 family peptidase [Colwellia ponticola]|uniref:S9 family peptidase n=1 Tax=Colwellia ponticola TaxID=2304625 RepID=A0A8H2PK76_9GAMM|nr:S9 family peptidase [Colwellia ponticola]TMM45466.1 S9 family peptidase [Colwellia ponticola]